MNARIRIGAVAWIATLQFFIVETYVGIHWPGYSFITDRISDLGAGRSPFHNLVNGSMLLQGLLIGGGAWLMRGAFRPGRLRDLGIALIVINGLGVILVGLVPEDTNRVLHDIGAIALFLSGNIGLLALGPTLLHEGSQRRALGAAAVALGGIGIAGSLFFIARFASAHVIGVSEHLAVDALPLWLFIAGTAFLSRR